MKAKDFVVIMQVAGVLMLLFGYVAPNLLIAVLGLSFAAIGGIKGRMDREDAR